MNYPADKREYFKSLFISDTPLIDVRAEIEYEQGSFPTSINLPILNTRERHEVGIRYKEQGQESAETLGNELVSGDIRTSRTAAWLSFIDEHENAALYCFRGGRRSQIASQWLTESGRSIERIAGGYKDMRNYLLSQFEDLPALMIISGKTGVGKTELLLQITNAIDLEGRANHRGSAFGRHIDPQPSQINFENLVAVDLLKIKETSGTKPVFLEDEGRLIGRVHLPSALQAKMKEAPIVLLEDSTENRVVRIFDEYIVRQWRQYERNFLAAAYNAFSDYLETAIDAIRKRLGGAGHKVVRGLLDKALSAQQSGDFEQHKLWIHTLLEDYYDPMYSYQLEKKGDRIRFRGSMEEILHWTEQQRMR